MVRWWRGKKWGGQLGGIRIPACKWGERGPELQEDVPA